jgi:hypothetical protein
MDEDMEQGGPEDEGRREAARAKLDARLKSIVGRLKALSEKRISERKPLEDRWLSDLMQYHGQYDDQMRIDLDKAKKSQLFINLTRPKTDIMVARLGDLLFPTDEKNYGLQPTPVPSLTEDAEAAAKAAIAINARLKEKKEQLPEGQAPDEEMLALEEQARASQAASDELQAVIQEAKRRCELMAAEIDDQLKESLYHAVKRDQIEDAVKLGTGVTKGPVTGDKIRKGWKLKKIARKDATGQPMLDEMGQPVLEEKHELEMSNGDRPSMRNVDIWSFFPDMDVRTVGEGEGNLERHLMNIKKLQALSHLPGFDKDALRRLITAKPRDTAPAYMTTLRNITGDKQQIANDMYHVWEYTGPLSIEDMKDLAEATGDTETLADMAEVDPLTELNAVVWFCDDELLKFGLYPYDSGECMYSVFNLVKDESSIFGYGIPYMMRDAQKALNAAWRAMMDNAGLASGPQLIIDQILLEPADGDYTLSPRKIWLAKKGIPKENRAFETFDVPMHQVELANIITLAKQFIDDETGLPQIAQGDQGAEVTKTAQGMALLMNSANVGFRRVVKNFDDDVTTPDIRRFYDWNMQLNPKESIKGDYEVDARGSSVLLMREMQSQTLMAIATNFGAHPVYGPMLKNREVMRKLFQALMIPAGDVLMSDDEIDALMARAAENDPAAAAAKAQADLQAKEMELAEQKMQIEVEMANMEADLKVRLAEIERDTQMMMMAERMNMSIDAIQASLEKARMANDSKERQMAAEIAVEARNAAAARARGEDPTGSGGFISAGGTNNEAVVRQ